MWAFEFHNGAEWVAVGTQFETEADARGAASHYIRYGFRIRVIKL